MSWQEKLRILVDANKQGRFTEYPEGLYYSEPLDAKRIDAIVLELGKSGLAVPRPLQDLYRITNGMIIGPGIQVFRLADGKSRHLQAVNDSALTILQENTSGVRIELAFGGDDVGDLFCLSDSGAVVLAGYNTPEAVEVAESLDAFFDNVCMGRGFIDYFRTKDDDPWVSILRELNFLQA
jgi:hypothetical protein